MKKSQLIDLCRNYVSAVDKGDTYHPVVVEYMLGRVINTILYEVFSRRVSELDLYTKTFTYSVSETGGDYWVDLSTQTSIVQFPGVGDGVRAVYPVGSVDVMFYPITIENAARNASMEYMEVDSDVPYVVKNTRVEFVANMVAEIAEVKMDLVRPFEAYGQDEEYYVPAGQDMVMFGQVLELLMGKPPADLRNDNNPTRR